MITIANWIANLYLLGLGIFLLGIGLFIIAVIWTTLWDEATKKWEKNAD